MRRKFFKILLTSIITLFVTVILGEVLLRLKTTYVVQQDLKKTGLTLETDPHYLYIDTPNGTRLRPNVNAVIRHHYLSYQDITIKTNSFGFRGDEIPPKIPDEQRVLVLGDSITLADYLDFDKIYTSRMEYYLKKNSGGNLIRVINAGMNDIGMKEEVDILSEKGLETKPDVVVVAFYLNDSRPPWGFPNELGNRGWLRQHSVLAETLYKNLVLFKFINDKGLYRFRWLDDQGWNWAHDRNIFLKFAGDANFDWGAAWDPNSWTIIDREMNRLKTEATEKKFKVVIVVFPVLFQLYTDFNENYPQTVMHDKAQNMGFYFLDLLPLYQQIKYKPLFYDWAHIKEIPNDLVGKEIADFLINNKIIHF